MGKVSRRKHLEAQKQLFFGDHGDGRTSEQRAKARAVLDALQKKIEDDALREDGFYFIDGKFADARRPRVTPGMKTRSLVGHTRSVKCVTIISVPLQPSKSNDEVTFARKNATFLLTFGLDYISIWNFDTGDRLQSMDVATPYTQFICGATAPCRFSGELAVKSDRFCFAYATYRKPVVHIFNCTSNNISSSGQVGDNNHTWSYCTDHQQQITCLALSRSGEFLATTSLDSTCMLWKIEYASVDMSEEARIGIVLVEIFPICEDLASCVAFAFDDQELITCGDCVIKLWDLKVREAATQQSSSPSMIDQRREWEAAIPFGFSVNQTLTTLAFDDALSVLVPNHDWVYASINDRLPTRTLLAPQPSQATNMSHSHIGDDEGGSQVQDRTANIMNIDGHRAITNSNAASNSSNSTNKPYLSIFAFGTGSLEADTNEATVDDLNNMKQSNQLRKEYEQMVTFDFEKILDPSAALDTSDSNSEKPTELQWPQLRTDGNGHYIRSFRQITENGTFASHTSTITCCAVAKEVNLAVTGSLDKSIKYWAYDEGFVLETIRNAHSAPITCCALTLPSTMDPGLDMLLATGGKDNLVKIWRKTTVSSSAECVFSLTGHYDAITSCVFDPRGVFLVSTGDDTNVITWRVRPSCPDSPSMPTVVQIDRFAITIAWEEPLANGSPLLHYIVRTTQVSSLVPGGLDIKVVPDIQTAVKYTTQTVTALQPGIQYRLQVAAVNAIGTSAFSESTPPIETLAFMPSQVEKPVQYHDCQATRIRLTWKQPSCNGAVINSYTLQCRPEKSAFVPLLELSIPVCDLQIVTPHKTEENTVRKLPQKTTKTSLKSTTKDTKKLPPNDYGVSVAATPLMDVYYSYIIEGLWAGEVYQFVVAAENRCGLGPFSRISDYVKMNSTAPDAPLPPVVTRIDKRQVEVQWQKPRCNGSDILQYTVQWTQELAQYGDEFVSESPKGSTTTQTIVLLTRSIVGTTYTLTDLEPGKPLLVWVSASNLIDNKLCDSEISSPSEIVYTLCDVPDAPLRPQLIEPSSHSLILAFTPPKDNGQAIERYHIVIYCEEEQFGITTKRVLREFKLEKSEVQTETMGMVYFTVKKLRGKMFYSAMVSASNALGQGKMSECSLPVATKPPTVPAIIAKPPNVSNLEPTKAIITWDVGDHDGGSPLISFHLQYTAISSHEPTPGISRRNQHSEEEVQEVAIFHGTQFEATFLRPKTTYRFRIASANAIEKSAFSPFSDPVTTPSLVEFTVTRYFANRPEIEHNRARYIQKRYRAWKRGIVERENFLAGLKEILRTSWHGL